MVSPPLVPNLLYCALLSLSAAQAAQIQLDGGKPPKRISEPVDGSFLGFGIETSSVPNYVGNETHPNKLSMNLFKNLKNRGLESIRIRVGGTSMDHSQYNPDLKHVPVKKDGGKLSAPMDLGPLWVSSLSSFPDYANLTLQVPLARKNISNGVAFAKASLKAIGKERLEALEIGNEPNNYVGGSRPKDYSPQDYVKEWYAYADELLKKEVAGAGEKLKFTAFDGSTRTAAPFLVPQLDKAQMLKRPELFNAVSQHYYQTVGGASLQNTLMNHTDTTTKLQRFADAARYLQKNHPQIPLIIGEAGQSLAKGHGKDYELDASLGSALWNVDFMLRAMCDNIKAINSQLGNRFPFAAWIPSAKDNRPAVQGSWYGQIFIADFIGSAKGGSLRVAELDVTGGKAVDGGNGGKNETTTAHERRSDNEAEGDGKNNDKKNDDKNKDKKGDTSNNKTPTHLAAYASYNQQTLTQIAILNLELYRTPNTTSDEPSKNPPARPSPPKRKSPKENPPKEDPPAPSPPKSILPRADLPKDTPPPPGASPPSTPTPKRPSETITLTNLPTTVSSLKIQRLTGASGTELRDISYAGQTWKGGKADGTPESVKGGVEVRAVKGCTGPAKGDEKCGSVEIEVKASEAVLVTVNAVKGA